MAPLGNTQLAGRGRFAALLALTCCRGFVREGTDRVQVGCVPGPAEQCQDNRAAVAQVLRPPSPPCELGQGLLVFFAPLRHRHQGHTQANAGGLFRILDTR